MKQKRIEYISVCPYCGAVHAHFDTESIVCPSCSGGQTVFTGYKKFDWYNLYQSKRAEIVDDIKSSVDLCPDGDPLYSINGTHGRHLDVYNDMVIISNHAGFVNSVASGVIADYKKMIYYSDCVGLQYHLPGFIQFETAGATVTGGNANTFWNENTVQFDSSVRSDVLEAFSFIRKRLDEIKNPPDHAGAADALLKYKQLLDMGGITQEEYDIKKSQLLA